MAKPKTITTSVSSTITQTYALAPDIRERDDFFMPSEESLDFLLDHDIDSLKALRPFLDRKAANDFEKQLIETYGWFDSFLPALQWFIDLAEQALQSPGEEDFDNVLAINPNFATQRATLSSLLSDVMVAYVPALQETHPYHDLLHELDVDHVIELLRRYWMYVRYVKSFAHEAWPSYRIPHATNPAFRMCPCQQRIRDAC